MIIAQLHRRTVTMKNFVMMAEDIDLRGWSVTCGSIQTCCVCRTCRNWDAFSWRYLSRYRWCRQASGRMGDLRISSQYLCALIKGYICCALILPPINLGHLTPPTPCMCCLMLPVLTSPKCQMPSKVNIWPHKSAASSPCTKVRRSSRVHLYIH